VSGSREGFAHDPAPDELDPELVLLRHPLKLFERHRSLDGVRGMRAHRLS
jgi:hypothetical protein